MKPIDIDMRVLAAMRELAAEGVRVDTYQIRRRLGETAAIVREAIQRLRWKGMIEWDRLAVKGDDAPPAQTAPIDETPAAEPAGREEDRGSQPLPPIQDQVRAEAERAGRGRRAARSTGSTVKAPLVPAEMTAGELVATAFLDEPAAVALMLRRKWPDLWNAVLIAARREGARPVEHLVEIIARGVEA